MITKDERTVIDWLAESESVYLRVNHEWLAAPDGSDGEDERFQRREIAGKWFDWERQNRNKAP